MKNLAYKIILKKITKDKIIDFLLKEWEFKRSKNQKRKISQKEFYIQFYSLALKKAEELILISENNFLGIKEKIKKIERFLYTIEEKDEYGEEKEKILQKIKKQFEKNIFGNVIFIDNFDVNNISENFKKFKDEEIYELLQKAGLNTFCKSITSKKIKFYSKKELIEILEEERYNLDWDNIGSDIIDLLKVEKTKENEGYKFNRLTSYYTIIQPGLKFSFFLEGCQEYGDGFEIIKNS